MHDVAWVLTTTESSSSDPKQMEKWTYANKVCRHTVISAHSKDLFDVDCSYNDAKEIWESITMKQTAEDADKQKFVIGNFSNLFFCEYDIV